MNNTDPRAYLIPTFTQEQVDAARKTKQFRITQEMGRFSNYERMQCSGFDALYQGAIKRLKERFDTLNVDPDFDFIPQIEIGAETDYEIVKGIFLYVECEAVRVEDDSEVRCRLASEMLANREAEARKVAVVESLRYRVQAAHKRIAEEQEKIDKINEQLNHLTGEQ